MDTNAQQIVDRTGIFRVRPLSWTLEQSEKSDSQSVAVAIQYGIVQEYAQPDQGEPFWGEAWPPGWCVYGRTYIVKRDGQVNEPAVLALKEAGIWNGDIDAFNASPPDVVAIVTVQENEYQGRVSMRADWLQPNADVPRTGGGGLKPADPGVMASMKSRFGGSFRAIGGAAPSGQAAAPPQPPQGQPAPPQAQQQPAQNAPAPTPAPAPAPAQQGGRAPAPPSQPAPFVADEEVPF